MRINSLQTWTEKAPLIPLVSGCTVAMLFELPRPVFFGIFNRMEDAKRREMRQHGRAGSVRARRRVGTENNGSRKPNKGPFRMMGRCYRAFRSVFLFLWPQRANE